MSKEFVFPTAVRRARVAQKMTQAKLATLMGVTPNRVCQIESDDRGLREDIAIRAANALGLTLETLAAYFYVDNPQ